MKIFMVTRGSHGDIYPYLSVASELVKRGHDITLSLPEIFEKEAKTLNLKYILQKSDDIGGMLEGAAQSSQSFRHILKWIRRAIDVQFEQFIPVVQEHDLFVSANTEFAAVSIAEYCRKPIIRTAYAPLIPGRQIPPPIIPLSNTNAVLTPSRMWSLLNRGTDFMVKKTLNKNRKALGMPPIKTYGMHAAGNAYNYLMFDNHVGSTDPNWAFKWEGGGYCFNNSFEYDNQAYEELMSFINKDRRPSIFFTLGSCDAKKKDLISRRLLEACYELDYKLIVNSGWSKIGSKLMTGDSLFIMDKPIPHNLIFPSCSAVIHHGGSGTTHSVAGAGIPQMIIPLIIDQEYWASRVKELGIGSGMVKITASKESLKNRLKDLVDNPLYKQNAKLISKKINATNGVKVFCDYIEGFETTLQAQS